MKHEVLKKIVYDFFVIQAESAMSFAIIGSIFLPKQAITYHYFFLPFIMGIICMLPCLPVYLIENMTIKQVIFQRVVEFVVLEVAILYIMHIILGNHLPTLGYVAIGLSILILDIFTYTLSWYFEKDQADKLNEQIKKLRQQNKNID